MAPAIGNPRRRAVSNQAMVLGVVLGLLLPASLQATAQDLTGMTGIPGSTALERSLLRQADEYARMAIEEARSRSRNARADGWLESLTLIERRTNIAVGKGSVACSFIGGIDETWACVSGDDSIAAPGREQ